jgi:predicted transcriptional regulator
MNLNMRDSGTYMKNIELPKITLDQAGSDLAVPVLTSVCPKAVDVWTGSKLTHLSELAVAAAVTQEIKTIDTVAQGLGLTATNALLVAKRASAIGFSVVARELHSYAKNLETELFSLVQQIHDLVRFLAVMMQKRRQMQKLCHACASGEMARSRVGPACDLSRNELAQLRQHTHELWNACESVRSRVEKRCKMGIAVGHSAMIEASQGEIEKLALRQIAKEVGETVDTILKQVRQLDDYMKLRSEERSSARPVQSVTPK